MTLSAYHQKYANQSDEELERRVKVKEEELRTIFEKVKLQTDGETVRVAVLGCGDKRFVKAHKKLFEQFTKKSVELTTFDITIEHLQGEENVIQHDCTLPLLNPPYDITFAHVLLKFIETDKQLGVIKNSYNSLKPGGFAIHIMDNEEIETKEKILPSGQYAVPLQRWKELLNQEGITFSEIPLKYGIAIVVIK